MNPVDVIESPEQLEKLLREWQHILFLDGWSIIACITDTIIDVNGDEVGDASGLNTLTFESSQASIQLLSERSFQENQYCFKHCMEKDLVHELLHCKYVWMENKSTYEGTYLEAKEHQILEEMAKSLIMTKYGVDYNYFL